MEEKQGSHGLLQFWFLKYLALQSLYSFCITWMRLRCLKS